MSDNLKHLAILNGYNIDGVMKDGLNDKSIPLIEVWIIGIINCLENAVYQNQVSNTTLISEISSVVNNYHGILRTKSEDKSLTEYIQEIKVLVGKILSSQDEKVLATDINPFSGN